MNFWCVTVASSVHTGGGKDRAISPGVPQAGKDIHSLYP